MNKIPEFATILKLGEAARAMRPVVNGKALYDRIPIRRRQLKHEVENFIEWLGRLYESELEVLAKDPQYPRFFTDENTALLIIAQDRGEIIQAEIGTREQVEALMQHYERNPNE